MSIHEPGDSAAAHRRHTEKVEFSFELASPDEARCIHDLVVIAAEGVPEGQFVVNDLETIERQMHSGFTLEAHQGDDLAGILHVYFPSDDESYAKRVGDQHPADEVAHMDIAAVLPQFRGHGLLGLLLAEAEAHLRAAEPLRTAWYATVHPDNVASRRSFEVSGYVAVESLTIHGAYPRIVFRKGGR